MTAGEGIFFGLLLASLVTLYVATRDRWRWRRILAWGIAVCLLPVLATSIWIGVERWSETRPRYVAEYWELRPGMSTEEVLFRKGAPGKKEPNFWVYMEDSDKVGHVVGIKDGRIRFVMAVTRDRDSDYLPSLQGINSLSSSEDLKAHFGEPDGMSDSENGTRRHLSFSKFGVSFELERNRVKSVGIFDPTHGPIRYAKEAPATSP